MVTLELIQLTPSKREFIIESRFYPALAFMFHKWGTILMGLVFTVLLFDTGASAILMQQKWPLLFEGLGCISAFAHQPPVAHVIQPLFCITLAFHDGFMAELQQLLDACIVEPLNALPWVSNRWLRSQVPCISNVDHWPNITASIQNPHRDNKMASY